MSGVEESGITAASVADLTGRLAQLKAEAVAALVGADPGGGDAVIIGCDSLLDLDGEPLGKPASSASAVHRWRRMRGRAGVLHTGHHLVTRRSGAWRAYAEVASTTVHFADLSDAEIDAYVATGEPLQVAGAFTIDGLGGAFVTRIEGDHHNVVGISLPVLRTMLGTAGVDWPSLWVSAG